MIRANVDVTFKGPASFLESLLTPLKLGAEPVNLFDWFYDWLKGPEQLCIDRKYHTLYGHMNTY